MKNNQAALVPNFNTFHDLLVDASAASGWNTNSLEEGANYLLNYLEKAKAYYPALQEEITSWVEANPVEKIVADSVALCGE